jgi:hypothetical protein
VRQSHPRKSKHEISPVAHRIRKTAVTADHKSDLFGSGEPMSLNHLGQLSRIDLSPALVEGNEIIR